VGAGVGELGKEAYGSENATKDKTETEDMCVVVRIVV